jgi:hypothetical protein
MLFTIPLIALSAGMLLPALIALRRGAFITAYWVTLVMALVGTGLLFWARLPLYRQRRFFSFGSHALPPASVSIYRTAYALLIPSILVLLFLALSVM